MKDKDFSKNQGEKPEEQNQKLREQLEALQQAFEAREEELKELRAINESNLDFYENAPCGFHVTDENGLILKMNMTELNRLGYTRQEVEGKMHVLDILSEKSKILFYKYLPIYRDEGKLDLVDVEYLKKDGSLSVMSISIRSDYDEQGNFKGGRTYLWDISNRERAEKEMLKITRRYVEAKQVLEEKNAVLDKLNAELMELKRAHDELGKGVANHIMQPLDKALSICNQLLNDPSFSPQDQKEMLTEMYQTMLRLDDFLKSFKSEESVDMEQSRLEISRFSLSALMVMIVNRLEQTAKKKDLTLTLEIYKEYWLEADQEIMKQVLDMLMYNAISVAQNGAEILLKLAQEAGRYLIDTEIIPSERRQATSGRMFPPKEKTPEPEERVEWDLDLVETLVSKLGYELIWHMPDQLGWVRLIIPLKS